MTSSIGAILFAEIKWFLITSSVTTVISFHMMDVSNANISVKMFVYFVTAVSASIALNIGIWLNFIANPFVEMDWSLTM